MRVVGNVSSLAAFIVREKNEAALVQTLKENDTRGLDAIFVRSRESGGVHFRSLARACREQELVELNEESSRATTSPDTGSLIEPHFELYDRIGFEIAVRQAGKIILAPKIRDAHKVTGRRMCRPNIAMPGFPLALLPGDAPS